MPAALKAKYEKKVKLSSGTKASELPLQLQEIFKDQEVILWEDALKVGLGPMLQREASKGHLEVIYIVKEKLKKKLLKVICPLLPSADLETELNSLPQRAEKQKEVLRLFC